MYVPAEATLWRSQTEETEMSRYNPRVAATRSQASPAPAPRQCPLRPQTMTRSRLMPVGQPTCMSQDARPAVPGASPV